MRIRVLGSAAGGGFPQWNCNCTNCAGVRSGAVAATPRTQSSIAVSSDDERWVLCNASPDLLAQIRSFGELQPARAIRDTALVDVVLVDAQIDHTLGLLMMREGGCLRVWCTDRVREELTHHHPIFPLLSHYCGVELHSMPIEAGSSFVMPSLPSVECQAIAVPGNAPPFSPARDAAQAGDNIALCWRDTRSSRTLVYAPGLSAIEPHVREVLQAADVVLIDGTFWSDDELVQLGVSSRRARQMGHLPLAGPGGMLELLAELPAQRKILIHINNTNPILDERSPERTLLEAADVEVAYDGMELEL